MDRATKHGLLKKTGTKGAKKKKQRQANISSIQSPKAESSATKVEVQDDGQEDGQEDRSMSRKDRSHDKKFKF